MISIAEWWFTVVVALAIGAPCGWALRKWYVKSRREQRKAEVRARVRRRHRNCRDVRCVCPHKDLLWQRRKVQ